MKRVCAVFTVLAVSSFAGCGASQPADNAPAKRGTSTAESKTVALDTTDPAYGETTVRKKRARIAGTATPGSKVAVLGADDIVVPSSGRWHTTVPVKVGSNEIPVYASMDGYESSRTEYIDITRKRTAAEVAALRAKRAAARARREAAAAARVANFKASCQSIPYGQLVKNPSKYEGEHVVYEGQIAEVQEDSGVGIMRLNVTNDGYGFWDDDVWVDYEGEIDSAEDDVVTIYGTVTGEKSYDTEIGGSRSIPQIEMRYVEE